MAKVPAYVLQSNSVLTRAVTVSDGGTEVPANDRWIDLPIYQELLWYPDFAAFRMLGDVGSYLLEIWVADQFELDLNPQRAIVVPFRVTDAKSIFIVDDDNHPRIPMKSGQYQLLFQDRFLTDDELKLLSGFDDLKDSEPLPPIPSDEPNWWNRERNWARPDLVRLTFIPTTEIVEAKSIREDYQDQDRPLIMLDD